MGIVTGVSSIQAQKVEHCQGAFGVSVTFSNDFKFSFSGDCRPSAEFAKIGKGSTVLVHEATFENDMRHDALDKKHSTTSEAINVGLDMAAENILLTHFSQRYQKIPVMGSGKPAGQEPMVSPSSSEESDDTDAAPQKSWAEKRLRRMHVGIAFDYMRVKVGEIRHLRHFIPALTKLFSE